MRVIILSCNTGEGHNSAAKAVKDCFDEKNIECEISDALAFWSPEKSKIISKGHIFVYRRLPKLFGAGYRFEENHPAKKGDDSFVYDMVIKGCEALYNHLIEGEYSAIICTHVFSSLMMTEIKRRYNYNVKTYFVATDYTCSPCVSETKLDTYFIPHEKLCDEFVQNGIPREKLVPCGIPVRTLFYKKTDSTAAKQTLSLPKDNKIILLACGSMGCGPIKALTEYLPQQLPDKCTLVVICGNNRRLYKSLTKNPLYDNLRVVGYTTRMSLYMDAASLIMTKPGGLSSTEASVKHLPMIFINAVPGCETRNLDFFVNNGLADNKKKVIELCDLVCDYIDNPAKLEKMSLELKNDFKNCASTDIRDFIIKDNDTEND